MAKTPETRPEIVNTAALKGCVEQQLDWCLVSLCALFLASMGNSINENGIDDKRGAALGLHKLQL